MIKNDSFLVCVEYFELYVIYLGYYIVKVVFFDFEKMLLVVKVFCRN